MIIYKITNLIDGKVYVGLTRKNNIKERWERHLQNFKYDPNKHKPLYVAMEKLGVENFQIEKIDEADSIQELSEKEKYWINFHKSTNSEFGYNICKGGIFLNSDSEQFYRETSVNGVDSNYGKYISQKRQGITSRPSGKMSRFLGISKRITKNNTEIWFFRIVVNKKAYSKTCESEIEAAISYDKIALYFYGDSAITNFPQRYSCEELDFFFKNYNRRLDRSRHDPDYISGQKRYKYISYDKNRSCWRARLKINGKSIFDITAETQEMAFFLQQKKLKELGLFDIIQKCTNFLTDPGPTNLAPDAPA